MNNRIREFRNKNGLSQSQFVHEFNEFLNNKKLKSITIPTFSRWENSINSPTETMWKYLSNVMKVPTLMLKGAYSQKEILEVLKNSYISESKKSSLSYSEKISEVSFNVDLICIAQGLLPYDEPRFNLLSEKEINNIDFWNENFSFIFNSIAVKWLITKPLDATKEDIVDALNDALSAELLKLEKDGRTQKDGKEWIKSPKELLQKRQDFINEHTLVDEDGEAFIDF